MAGRTSHWVRKLNDSRHPLWIIGVLSFLETIIIPVPIEVILIPMMAANRSRIWLIATITFGGCLAAAILGYGVGMVLYESVGRWFLEAMSYQDAYESFKSFFDEQGFIATLLVGIVPIPFQIAMITAGLAGYPFYLFVIAAAVARGVRYYGLAWLVARFGHRARQLWQRHAVLAGLGGAAVIAALYFAGQYVAGQII
jgi:membrane protein YqaA with SNARE-associated domain